MDWFVPKTGLEQFDMLHASGVGLMIANGLQRPVKLIEEGLFYHLQSQGKKFPALPRSNLHHVLRLPSAKQIRIGQGGSTTLKTANLDGLLAARFTTRGVRLLSVYDLLSKQKFYLSTAKEGLSKAKTVVKALEEYALHKNEQNWLDGALKDYQSMSPAQMELVAKTKDADLSIPMTLDPALGHSSRRVLSDGYLFYKTSATIHGTSCAALFAYIGAARFLRAQRVSGNQIIFYLPLAKYLLLEPDTALPVLFPIDCPADQALVRQWLSYEQQSPISSVQWSKLAFQIMQASGMQQYISIERGCLDSIWLTALRQRVNLPLIRYWQFLFARWRGRSTPEVDRLTASLLRHSTSDWLAHLEAMAQIQSQVSHQNIRGYSVREVREVIAMMSNDRPTPLGTVLTREAGTLRFGHALRLLGRFRPGILHDLTDAFDTVQNQDQLLRVLGRAAQECVIASAQSQFIIIPSDEDFKYLLEDVDLFTAQTVARLLIVLSVLRYPKLENSSSPDGPNSALAIPTSHFTLQEGSL